MTSWPAMNEVGPHIEEGRVSEFEKLIGAKLPDEYRRFLIDTNGGQPRDRMFSYGDGTTTLNALDGLDHENEALDLMTYWEMEKERIPQELLSIGHDDGGAMVALVLSGPRCGQVWFCTDERPTGSNPRVGWFDRRDVWKVADSFEAFMAGLRPSRRG
jgi:hypothetical protein